MLFLVNDLVDLFQIRNGKFRKIEQWVNPRTSFNEFIGIFTIGTEEKGISLNFWIDHSVPDALFIDDKRIK